MSKPHGVALGMTEKGPTMSVTRPTGVEDAIWEAVESAILDGWSPERFRREALQAWRERVDRQAKWDKKDAEKALRP